MNAIRNALIIGAGIAGSSAAIALAQRGVEVTLVEKQSEWRFQSSGIFVYSNGLAALGQLGVLDGILQAGFAVDDGKNIYLDHWGEPITDVYYPRGPQGEPPIVGIKRAEMHRVLAEQLQRLDVSIRLGLTVVSLQTGSAAVRAKARFSDDSHGEYDLVLGADGIRSQVRNMVFGNIQPRSTGFGVWRSVHRRPADLDKKIMQMGIGKRLGIMPISEDRLYIFGTVPETPNSWYEPQHWPELMREKFRDFQGPARQFLDEVGPDSEVLYTLVEEVACPPPWHRGRVLIIGDAAHASTPFMGQGGAMAIEDAVVLGKLVTSEEPINTLMTRFESQRYPVCKFVQDASRRVGEAGAMEDPESCEARNANMRQNAQQQVDDFYHTLDRLRV